MNPSQLLGQPFESVSKTLDHGEVSVEHLGTEIRQYVSANDGTWSFILSASAVIETVFLYADAGANLPYGLARDMQPEDVIEIMGDPVKSGDEFDDEVLGKKGRWQRFNRKDKAVHVEYTVGRPFIRLITLMLPKRIPKDV